MQRTSFPRIARPRIAGLAVFVLSAFPAAWAEDYTLETVAFSADYPADTDPAINTRAVSNAQLNQLGQVLFGASWRVGQGNIAANKSSLHFGRPGGVTRIAGSGDPVPGYPNHQFSPHNSSGQGVHAPGRGVVNADGEYLFAASAALINNSPGNLTAFSYGLFKGSGGSYQLIGAIPGNANPPPSANVADVPYSGPGQLRFSNTSFGRNTSAGYWLSDSGRGYFLAGIYAQESGGSVPVVDNGSVVSTDLRLINYVGNAAPGLNGDYVFREISGSPIVAQKTGGFVFGAYVVLRNDPNPDANKRWAFYDYANDTLHPIYVKDDPLPGLPPLPEVLGTDQPYDVIVTLAGVDEVGHALFYAYASARNFIDARPLGYWKQTANGLVKVMRWGQDHAVAPPATGTVRFLAPPTGTGAAMGNGKAAFLSDFTGFGYASPRLGLFRETDAGFELLATAGTAVPGTTLTPISFNGNLWMNEYGDVAFRTETRDGASGPGVITLWMASRNGSLGRIFRLGQTLTLGGAPRTISNFQMPLWTEPGLALNALGVVAVSLTFSDGTSAIVRGVPPGYQDPPLPGPEYWFNNAKNDGNWHTTSGSPPTNWEDQDGVARAQAPGDADANTADTFIESGHSVLLDQRAAAVATLNSEGDLTLRDQLTLNVRSELKHVVIENPRGALTFNGDQLTLHAADVQGNLSLNNAVLRSEGLFVARSGTVANLGGTATAFENRGLLRKDGGGVFTINTPIRVFAPATSGAAAGISVMAGKLSLLGGGAFTTAPTTTVVADATLELAGTFNLSGPAVFEGTGHLLLGTSTQDAVFDLAAGASLTFDLKSDTTEFNRGELRGAGDVIAHNLGHFVWRAGRIGFGTGAGVTGYFHNDELFEIDESAAPRRLEGVFVNSDNEDDDDAIVRQRGAIELAGTIENNSAATWQIDRGVNITASGGARIVNFGTIDVSTSPSGVVNLGPSLLNKREFIVGYRPTPGETTTVQLTAVENLAGTTLLDGTWVVGTHGSLDFPGDVKHLAARTAVWLDGGAMPDLKPETSAGILRLTNRNLTTDDLEIFRSELHGIELMVEGTSVLTINGSLTALGDVWCLAPARIAISGDLYIGPTGTLQVDGAVAVDGKIRIDGRLRGEGDIQLEGSNSLLQFANTMTVASSPGTLTINGAVEFLNTATAEMELAGTAPGAFDVLAVTGDVTLGGTLVVPLLDGFQPSSSHTFAIIQAGSISGAYANVASGARVSAADGSGSFQVFYGGSSPHNPNHVVLANWLPAVSGSPVITSQPSTQVLAAGGALTLTVTASGSGPLSYQWRYQGSNIAGATNASYAVLSAQGFHAGSYSVVVTNSLGTVYSSTASVTVDGAAPSAARLLNLSTRGLAQSGDNVLIPGFVIDGTASKKLLIRAVGPTLAQEPFKLAGTLPDPRMRLLKRNATSGVFEEIANNDDWGTNTNAAAITQTAADLFAFAFKDAKESALLLDLAPGQYTTIAGDKNDTSGIGIVELYDADTGMSPASRLINISNRGFCGVGDQVMIPGFVVSSEGPKTLLVRVVGPGLNQFGVTGTMADPKLEIFPGGASAPILANDNWGDNLDAANTAQIASQVSAFPLTAGSKDAAFVVTLAPGTYTVVGSSAAAGGTGVVLVEVYVVP